MPSENGSRADRVAVVLLLAVIGGLFGAVTGRIILDPLVPGRTRVVTPAHHTPKSEGGVSLRYAMVHDVVHERYPKRGEAYYRERNRLATEELALTDPDDPRAFELGDDLAAGLDKLGRPDEAVAVLRDKLARQERLGLAGIELYSSYANLGTFLIHANLAAATAGDPAARERLREGLAFVRKSIEVNPQAHFGREQWQAVIVEFILQAIGRPELLRRYDFIGNDLSRIPAGLGGPAAPSERFEERQLPLSRGYIRLVGAEGEWPSLRVPSVIEPVAFDEPVLGVIGMWREGGGANPHFCLMLGETMLRVRQRHLAWSAFERASRLAERFWPDPELRQFLRDHCRVRQERIAATLPPDEASRLREAFDAELAKGLAYQEAYQRYETDRIAAGRSVRDPDFFADFDRDHGPIATPVGAEEWVEVTVRRGNELMLPAAAVGAGVFGFLGLWVSHRKPSRP